jgi:hypothetical protein
VRSKAAIAGSTGRIDAPSERRKLLDERVHLGVHRGEALEVSQANE